MSTYKVQITQNESLALIRKYQEHKQQISGMIEANGDFGGGVLKFFISLSGGDGINSWNDFGGSQFQIGASTTREFLLPVVSMNNAQLRLYYTLEGATSPDITLTVGDNT